MTGGLVCVTGVAGFIGSQVAAALLERGDQVVGVDSFDPYYPRAHKEAALEAVRAHPGFSLREMDVRDRHRLPEVLRGVDAVIHLAARPGVRQSVDQPDLYRELNEAATQSLLAACAAADVRRVVFASSSSVYGAAAQVPFREDVALGAPTSPYAATKQAGERLVGEFARHCDARAVILRLFSVYGPHQRPDLAIHRFARLMVAGFPVPVFGDGGSRRDYTHVSDVADGVLQALTLTVTASDPCQVFNLGAGCPVRLDCVVSELARTLGVEPRLESRPTHPADLPVTWADTEKARRVLGFAPRVSLAEGIREFADWFERGYGRQPCPAA